MTYLEINYGIITELSLSKFKTIDGDKFEINILLRQLMKRKLDVENKETRFQNCLGILVM